MTEITRTHAEWAVVDRLRQMLSEAPHAEYDVTQAYGLCVAVVAWVVQRIRTPERPTNTPEDRAAIAVKRDLAGKGVSALSAGLRIGVDSGGQRDLDGLTAFTLLVWLRNAFCHGDARQVQPVNKGGLLVGFKFRHKADNDHERCIFLNGDDLRSIGLNLAAMFCEQLQLAASSQPVGFIAEARSIREQRRAA